MLSRVSGSRLMWNADEVIHLRLQMAGLGRDVTRLGEARFELGDLPLQVTTVPVSPPNFYLKQSTPAQCALRPDPATVS